MELIKLFSREYSVQYTEVSIRSLLGEVKEHLPSLVLSQIYVPENKNETCCANPAEWEKFLNGLEKICNSPTKLKSFFKKFHTFGKAYVHTAQKNARGNLRGMSHALLAKRYVAYQKILIVYTAYLWMGYLLSQGTYLEKAQKILKNKSITDAEIITALLRPSKLSSVLALQEVIQTLKRKSNILNEKQATALGKKYAWISCLDVQNDPWTFENIQTMFAQSEVSGPQLSFSRAVSLAGLNQKEQKFFQLVCELVYVKDMRDEYRRRGIYAALLLFQEIANRLGLSRSELAYFTSIEILSSLKRQIKLDPQTAHARKNGFLVFWNGTNVVAETDSEIISQYRSNIRVNPDTQALRGIAASRGKTKGKAKIIFGLNDLRKIEAGDILVAITTHPDYVPAMQKAAAFVTDEGGITSHAAIVSREMNKPCIVGTKIATKVLKDGDMVEVDAERGIVTILKRSPEHS